MCGRYCYIIFFDYFCVKFIYIFSIVSFAGVRAFRVRARDIQFIRCYFIEFDTFILCIMSINLVRTVLRAFSLILRLLSASLVAVKKVLDIIDDGIENGSSVLPPWYFELVQVLNVIQESIDKVSEFSHSDILQKPLDNE